MNGSWVSYIIDMFIEQLSIEGKCTHLSAFGQLEFLVGEKGPGLPKILFECIMINNYE